MHNQSTVHNSIPEASEIIFFSFFILVVTLTRSLFSFFGFFYSFCDSFAVEFAYLFKSICLQLRLLFVSLIIQPDECLMDSSSNSASDSAIDDVFE